ncbi:MAG: [FeFe] hydrogenase H-cluster radical SAM maturase HydE [Bacteroidales bacterium]|nr:[FeFe] hydrogenase H-cluster radical SAM maturase HydE [Bacteroidales bacterium]
MTIQNILLNKSELTAQDIVGLLKCEGSELKELYAKSAEVKKTFVDNIVYLRGLIEFSNLCRKDCKYCGIRKSNINVSRYNISDVEIIHAAKFAFENRYGSIVLQSGEIKSRAFTKRVTNLLDKIAEMSDGKLRVTLSCGEQTYETYRQWFDHGASRYLLRIETTNKELYYKIHPNDKLHSFEERIEALNNLKSIGYQTGTGVMIGLPFQTYEDLANDLLWIKQMDIDMVGMGPYIEHKDTPLYQYKDALLPLKERFELTLKMIAVLRIIMKDINIAAATALQSIEKMGRERAIKIGANVLMPNITPGKYRDSYRLYDNKPCTDENPEDCQSCIEWRVAITNNTIAYDEWGDSKHHFQKIR